MLTTTSTDVLEALAIEDATRAPSSESTATPAAPRGGIASPTREPGFVQYHGTPITPIAVLRELGGYSFCVSYADGRDVARAHELAGPGGVMLDNGAFSQWRSGKPTDWPGFYAWAEEWLDASPTTWAIIPDVIDGTEAEQDELIAEWPHGDRGVPVWHLHESFARLQALAASWPRICFGSSGEYAQVGTEAWHRRVSEAFDVLCPTGGRPEVDVHMLRGMKLSEGPYPFASVDSTDIARNHNRGGDSLEVKQARALAMAKRWATRRPATEWKGSDAPSLFS